MAYARQDRITPLMNGHKGIRRQIDMVRNAARAQSAASTGQLQESIDRLASLVEKHFDDEESSLYRPLKLRLGKNNPVDDMAGEHKAIRQTLRRLRSVSTALGTDPIRMEDVKTCIDSLRMQVGEHMAKEETVLFWLAELKL